MVGMGFKRASRKLFNQSPNGVAVSSHAALLDDHIALLVKLPHHGVQEALGFEISPEFKPIFRQRVVIGGLVVISERVHVLAAILFDELAKCVADDVLVGLSDDVFPGFLQFLQFSLIVANAFIALRNVSGVGLFYLLQG